MPLKVYTDLKYLPSNCMPVTMLDPLWPGKSFENYGEHNLQTHRLDVYKQRFSELFEFTDITQSDFAVFPAAWELSRHQEGIAKLAALRAFAQAYQKKVIVFVGGDLPANLPFDDLFVFHTSLVAAQKKPNEYGMPALIEDLAATQLMGQLIWRNWQPKPAVGFCGTAYPLGMPWGLQKIKEMGRLLAYQAGLLKSHPHSVGYAPRAYALRRLASSSSLSPNIVIRPASPVRWAYGFLLKNKEGENENYRTEYFTNIINSDYVLCVRGNGNYSIRLYETLCMGRIPVIVDTGVVLPFETHIPWRELCVWVPEADIVHIDEIIMAFHARHQGSAFLELQQACRQAWVKWLSPEGFFSHFQMQLTFLNNY